MSEKSELEAITLEFNFKRQTTRTHLFGEVLGETQWSDQDVAIGSLYIKTQALEKIGLPKKVRVTIEPIN